MTDPTIDLRLYCHGLGDCNLVGLPKKDGSTFWILFDCGIHSAAKGGSAIMRAVVADIATITTRLDVVIGTHEHWDHLSGFMQAAEEFRKIDVGEVWFSWAENPADPDARSFDRYKADSATALASAAIKMREAPGFGAMADGVDALLGFVFGAKGEKVRDARERLRAMSTNVRHLDPRTMAPLPPDIHGVRAYVLGPPRDLKMLGIEDIPSETYGIGRSSLGLMPLANALGVNDGTLRVGDDPASPFDDDAGVRFSTRAAGKWNPDGTPQDRPLASEDARFLWDSYLGPADDGSDQEWRRIDGDWLASGAELALQLDSRTNNSSLVIAFELEATGKVLLFAADAQVGNWLSWSDLVFTPDDKTTVTGADLIAQTVFYKVGHHGSRNATLGPKGLERMDGRSLIAFNPTDESLASVVGWKDFPAPKLTARLKERSSGRYIQSDVARRWDSKADAPGSISDIHDFDIKKIGSDCRCVRLTIG